MLLNLTEVTALSVAVLTMQGAFSWSVEARWQGSVLEVLLSSRDTPRRRKAPHPRQSLLPLMVIWGEQQESEHCGRAYRGARSTMLP